MKKSLVGILGFSLTLSCGSQQASQVDGHYEDATEASMARYEYQQTVVPEYAESQGVVISLPLLTSYGRHDLAREILDSGVDTLWITVPSNFRGSLSSSEFSRLRQVLGRDIDKVKLIPQVTDGSLTVWARDWAPLGALSRDGSLHLVDFNYYTNRPADDVTPQSMGRILGTDRVSVPVYNEGGNFMSNSRNDCLMTSRVTDANRYREVVGDMVLNDRQIADYYRRFAGCESVHILPRMPYEGTGHIDMWAKFLSDDVVIVGEIDGNVASYYPSADDQRRALEVKKFLDDRTEDLKSLGYRTVRIPMPAPEFEYYGAVMRSYTNSLLVNGRAIIPQYIQKSSFSGKEYIDQKRMAAMEAEALRIYRSFGYETAFVQSDRLIASGGAVHCTTMQIPR